MSPTSYRTAPPRGTVVVPYNNMWIPAVTSGAPPCAMDHRLPSTKHVTTHRSLAPSSDRERCSSGFGRRKVPLAGRDILDDEHDLAALDEAELAPREFFDHLGILPEPPR